MDSTRWERGRAEPTYESSGPSRPPRPLTMWHVAQRAAPKNSVSPCLGSPVAAAAATGDPKHGETLFFGAARCATCHIVSGRGGRLGPELSYVGSARPRSHLVESIREPNRQLTESPSGGVYDTVTAVTRDGKTIVGVPMNEDTFS